MHQTPRQPPRDASPAASPTTNPARTNNSRDGPFSGGHSRPGSSAAAQGSEQWAESSEDKADAGPSRESVKKLDQIIQNLFAKASSIVLQERIKTSPLLLNNGETRTSRWFQLETDDIEDFRDELRVYKQCGGFDNRPLPMVVEIFLDTSRLKGGQSLVLLDKDGKRHDVADAMRSTRSAESSSGRHGRSRSTHVILERWRFELKGSARNTPSDFGPLLPTIYKKAIVLFRSIYSGTGVLPARKLAKGTRNRGIHPALQLRARVSAEESPSSSRFDALRSPLTERSHGDITTDFVFGGLDVPVGRFIASVSYRNNCSFDVADTESLLSSQIELAISDDLFKPSLPHRGGSGRLDYGTEPGSAPAHRLRLDVADNQQRYGSLSTFHGEGPLGTSPISALKSIKAPGSDTTSPPDSRPASMEAPPHSLPIRPALIGSQASTRRPSLSFQPFKHGSLSGSPVPRMLDHDAPPSPHSLGRGTGLSSALSQARNRSSLTAGMPASLRGGPAAAEIPPAASSPRPAATNRFSSSFSHRRNRASFGGASRGGDDDQMSSGKQSYSSSAQPGSGLLNEAGGGGSSGSLQTEDDNIQDFLKMLESKRTLQSFEPSKKGESSKRTNAQLSKFHLMRESNNALTESMNSSMHLQRSSSSSSRQLANVPGMSISSSPGKPLSPHTPHTPAVPSRLSENSSVSYAAPVRGSLGTPDVGHDLVAGVPASVPAAMGGTRGAIDIPLSPRPYPHARRSSSVAQQNRALADDEDVEPHRSISLGANDREVPTLSTLLSQQAAMNDGSAESPRLQPPADARADESSDMLRQGSSSAERETRPPSGLFAGLSSSPQRGRYGISAGRGHSTPQSGNSSLTGYSRYGRAYPRGGASGGGGAVGGVPSDETEEEPLLFDMSELGRELNRRSLEEGRGTGSAGPGERGGYEPSRGSRRW